MNEQNIIFYHLDQIYNTKGRDKNSWKELIFSIKNCTFYSGIIYYFNQRIIREPSNVLTLDILDFLIDYGPINLLRELSKIDLMINILNLLKKSSGSGPEVQKKGIYLTKKWFEIANNHREQNFEGFIRNYYELNNKGISFPPSGYKLNTYEQYISIFEINNLLLNNNIQNLNNNNNKYYMNNDSNITPFEQESKYNNNDDIPSSDKPQLNNYENHSNFQKYDMNIYYNNRISENINKEINDSDFSNKNYFDGKEKSKDFYENNLNNKKEIEEDNKGSNPFKILNEKMGFPEQFENKFSSLKYSSFSNKPENNNENDNLENSRYPQYNEQKFNNNIKHPDDEIETPIGVDLYSAPLFNDVTETPFGNKSPIPKPNKQYNTIYNNEFKSYMEVTYGNNNKNNNNINNNSYNIIKNNTNENKIIKQNNIYNIPKNQNKINESNSNMNDSNNAALLYKHTWSFKISLINEWIDKGTNDTNEEQLKTGIKNILYEYNKIESLLQKNNKEEDLNSVSIILKLKSDMNQTCYRYERFINRQSYEKFYSAFDGNINVYNFNKEYLLSYTECKEHNNKYVEGLKKFGGAMKKGIFTAGKVMKDNTVKGINFVKEKVHKDKNNEIRLNKKNNRSNINDYSNSSDFNCNNNLNNNNLNNQINCETPKPFNYQQSNYNNHNYNNFDNNYNNQFNNFNNNQF